MLLKYNEFFHISFVFAHEFCQYICLFQYGKTAKFYVYAPGELDLNVLIGRCKEMPRKRDPEGKPQKFKMLPSQQMQQEAYSHASPPKGML